MKKNYIKKNMKNEFIRRSKQVTFKFQFYHDLHNS